MRVCTIQDLWYMLRLSVPPNRIIIIINIIIKYWYMRRGITVLVVRSRFVKYPFHNYYCTV